MPDNLNPIEAQLLKHAFEYVNNYHLEPHELNEVSVPCACPEFCNIDTQGKRAKLDENEDLSEGRPHGSDHVATLA